MGRYNGHIHADIDIDIMGILTWILWIVCFFCQKKTNGCKIWMETEKIMVKIMKDHGSIHVMSIQKT